MRRRSGQPIDLRWRIIVVALCGICAACAWAAEDPTAPPPPAFDRVKYDRPDDYLVLQSSLGNERHIREVAATLKQEKPERTLAAIHRWVNTQLKYDANAAYVYRDFDQACEQKVYGGCADYAVVFTALAQTRAELKDKPSGVAHKIADDGTRVILLYTRDVQSMRKLVDQLKID